MWSSWPWVSTIATTSSIRSRIEVKSGRMTSMPGWCSSGNSTPQSTTSSLPACSKTVMLRPISPRPPRAITRSPPSGRAGGVRSSGWLRLMAGTLRRGPDSGTGATAPGAVTPVRECRKPLRSDRADVLRLGALLALRDVELDLLSLVEGLVAVGDDGGVVAEDVGAAAVLGDEPEALLRVEPLHSALSHAVLIPCWGCPDRRTPVVGSLHHRQDREERQAEDDCGRSRTKQRHDSDRTEAYAITCPDGAASH